MSRRVWYLLAEKGSRGLSSKLKGEVECFDDTSIYQLKKLVLGENKITLGHTDAVNLEVWTYDDNECSAADELSNLASGDKNKPFIIYYPPAAAAAGGHQAGQGAGVAQGALAEGGVPGVPPETGGQQGSASGNIKQPSRFISQDALERVRRSTFFISDQGEFVGVGVFVTPNRAVTARHNLGNLQAGIKVEANFHDHSTRQLTILTLGTDFDYAVLESPIEHEAHLEMYRGDCGMLAGTDLILCSYLNGIQEYLPEFTHRLRAIKVSVMDVSDHVHHILYSANAFPGDSGGSLVVWDGQLIGLHIASVNTLQARYDREKEISDRVEAMEDSLENLACSVSDGFVGLLVTAFEKEFGHMGG